MSNWKKIFILSMIMNTAKATELTDSCGPIFEAQMISLNTEIPLEYVGRNEEDGCLCREQPKKFSVCFSSNDRILPCTKFPKMIKLKTPALLLESTSIEKLEIGDFNFLSHLEILALKGNQKFHEIDPYVFKNMTNLISLSFIYNPSLTFLGRNTFLGLVKLKELNLMKNGFHSIETLVQNLAPNILPKLCRLNLHENKFLEISENDLELMNGSLLGELDLNLCRIENIHPKSLKPLKYLQILRIGNNKIDSKKLSDLLKDTFSMGINIKSLDLYSSGFRSSLPTHLLEVLARSNISSLILTRNQFDIIDNTTFPIRMPKLLFIDLSDVSLEMIDEEAFQNLPNLKTLLLGKNRLSYFTPTKHLSKLTHLDLHESSGAYGAEFILSNSELHRLNLENLDLHHTPLIFLRKSDFANMTQLKTLNLENCSIIRMDNYIFSDLKNLKFLNLENNKMFYICKKIPLDLWGGLHNLEKLLLGGNGIHRISGPTAYLFKHLKKLKHLGLDRNSLTSISSEDFSPLVNLEVLDVSYNHLISWDDKVFVNNNLKVFRASANKMTHLSDAMLQDFGNLTYIEISFNSFICDCRVMNKMSTNKLALTRFLNLIEDQNILCEKSSNRTLKNFVRNVTISALNCDKKMSNLVFIIPLSILLILAVGIGALGYRYRWHLRYWMFLLKLFLIRKSKMKSITTKCCTNNYQFDAFVSYCSQDRNFVLNLVEMLENYAPYLKLCVYERDFQVGSVISESIREHIEKSRKTLLIVSNSYAKSHWCAWETQIAEHHRLFFENPSGEIIDESIVLIKLGLVEGMNLTPTLKYLLKTRIYLQWTDSDKEQVIFWQKLRQFLSPSEKQISEKSRF